MDTLNGSTGHPAQLVLMQRFGVDAWITWEQWRRIARAFNLDTGEGLRGRPRGTGHRQFQVLQGIVAGLEDAEIARAAAKRNFLIQVAGAIAIFLLARTVCWAAGGPGFILCMAGAAATFMVATTVVMLIYLSNARACLEAFNLTYQAEAPNCQ